MYQRSLINCLRGFLMLGVAVLSCGCGGGSAGDGTRDGSADQSAKRLIIVDDDVGFDAWGCFNDGFYHQYREANPQWTGYDPVKDTYDIVCDTDGGIEVIYNAWIADTRDDVELLGVTTVHGVTTSRVTYHSTAELLKRMGRSDIPVHQGAPNGPLDLGKETDAVRFIIDTVMSHPGQVEIIATGPLTNIATAMMLEPRLADNWKTIWIGSGNFNDELVPGYQHLGEGMGYPELNANMDPAAHRYVADHAKNAIWISGEATEIHPWCFSFPGDWNEVAVSGLTGNPFHKYVAEQLLPWLTMTATVGNEALGGSWNACAADSGTTMSSLVYFPENRGKFIDSAIDVIPDPSTNDGSVSNRLSHAPHKPVHRIYYTVNQERIAQLHDDAMAAIFYYPTHGSYLDDLVVPWIHPESVPAPVEALTENSPVPIPDSLADFLNSILQERLQTNSSP